MRSAALIYNPMSGKRRSAGWASDLAEQLTAAGWQVQASATDAPGAATHRARQLAHSGGVDTVFALGGDGTLREVAIGLLGSGVALGPLPGGTTNVLTRSLGLSADPRRALHQLLDGRNATWRVGLCGSTPFLMMASAGYDAEVVHRMDGEAKARWGRLAVGALGLSTWWRYRYPRFEASTAEGEKLPAHFAAVCNIPLYGGSFVLAPDADPTAETLQLVTHASPGRAASLGFALDLALGRHLRRKDVEVRTTLAVTLSGPPEVLLQIDGDACTEQLPVRISVAPETLELLVPN
ncbi:MAG: diacylglycerol kinase family lipid kinase [Thermoanaerobaculia bacterium]|nr:diacylglycerol kinase family lipid kinase [Thermoanaerobaculia bacterium]